MGLESVRNEDIFNSLSLSQRSKFGVTSPIDLQNTRKKQLVLDTLMQFFSHRCEKNNERYIEARNKRDIAEQNYYKAKKASDEAKILAEKEPTEKNIKISKELEMNSDILLDTWGMENEHLIKVQNYA